MKPIAWGALMLVGFASVARAETSCRPMLEVAPGYFLFGGAGVDVLADCPDAQLAAGVVLAGHVTFPTLMSEVFWHFDGSDDVTLHWNLAVGAEARYAFLPKPSSPYLQVVFGYERWSVDVGNQTGNHDNALFVVAPGYLWRPFDGAQWFHLNGQLLLVLNISGRYHHRLGSTDYGIRVATAVPNLSVGAAF
jgi:hypothetical protein